MKAQKATFGDRERGAAAVEFALVATMLMVLVFGILEGGRLWMIQGALSQAAREGVREMAINGPGDAGDVIAARTAHLGGGVVLNPPGISPGECTPGATAVVTVSANVHSMTGLPDAILPLFGGSDFIPLTGKAEMRCGG